MARSSRSVISRRLGLLAGAVVLAGALYSAGWFYAAGELKNRSLALLGDRPDKAISAECDNADYRGFPFRIGLFCSRVAIDDRVNGISATFGALRSAAQIYAPGHIVWELDSPVEIRTTHGLSISTVWDNFQSSLNAGLKGLDRASIVIENSRSRAIYPATGQDFDLSAGRSEIHLRQNGEDLDAAVTLVDTDIALRDLPQFLPRLTAKADIVLKDRAGIVTGKDPKGLALYSTAGEVRSLSADLGAGALITLSGPFSFDADGYLSGRIRLKIAEISAWRDNLVRAFPDLAPTLETVFSGLNALGGRNGDASIDLRIERGRVLLGGLITIGEIPPI